MSAFERYLSVWVALAIIAGLALGQIAFEQVAVEGEGFVDGLGAGVEQLYLGTAAGEQLGDAATHGAGADDADPVEHAHSPRSVGSFAWRNSVSLITGRD